MSSYLLWLLTFLCVITIICGNECIASDCNVPICAENGRYKIKSLFGYNPDESKPPLPTMYSGFIEVNKTSNGNLFYWLVMNQNKNDNAPLLIWLNGGPGGSSLVGLFAENGPFRLESSISLTYNKYTWAKYYNMLFIDNPINTGFAYCDDGQEVTNEDQMGQNFVTFMSGFYACFPQLVSNKLYITGESYAGKYIPFIWKWMVPTNMAIEGIALGNPTWNPYVQFYAASYYAFTTGFIDNDEYNAVNDLIGGCLASAEKATKTMNINILNISANICLDITNKIYSKLGGNIFQYDVRERNASFLDTIMNNLADYLSNPQVVKDINTGNILWKSSDGTSVPNTVANALNYDIMLDNTSPIYPQILANHTRILIFNGQFDGSPCNNYGTQQCLSQLNYKQNWNTLTRKPYFLNGLVMGYNKQSNDKLLTYFVVADSGHLVPLNQPEAALEMIQKWVENKL